MRLVKVTLDFKMTVTYNMLQSLIDEMLHDGPSFRSAFPDQYATNGMFLKAKRILIDPEPTTMVGITPMSYGLFHFNNQESEGMEFYTRPIPRWR